MKKVQREETDNSNWMAMFHRLETYKEEHMLGRLWSYHGTGTIKILSSDIGFRVNETNANTNKAAEEEVKRNEFGCAAACRKQQDQSRCCCMHS